MRASEVRPLPRSLLPMRAPLLLAVGLSCVMLVGACGGSKGMTATPARKPAAATPNGTTGEAASSRAVSAHVVTATSGNVTATMTAAGHNPRVSVPWPVSFAVERSGKPAKAEVRYQYLFGGAVVARRSHYRFTGRFHDTFNWPASAVGYPLTFRATIRSENATLNLDYPVQVRR